MLLRNFRGPKGQLIGPSKARQSLHKGLVRHYAGRDLIVMAGKKSDKGDVAMMWFRKGLRLHDNPALLEAVKSQTLYPVFCLDPWFVESQRVGSNRMKFLLESLEDLDSSLSKRKSGLLVLKGKPDEVFPKVWKEWGVTKLLYEKDFEPYAIERDTKIDDLAKKEGIEVSIHHSHTLFNPQELIEKNGGKAPTSMSQFQNLMKSMGDVPEPAKDPPKQFPALPKNAKSKDTNVPTLKDLKYVESKSPYRGGETAGLARLSEQLSDKDWVAQFEKPKGNPALFKKPATTCLSPYMKFGCVSARLFYHQVYNAIKGKNHSEPPVSLIGQLFWREWFYTVGSHTPNFDKMVGNPLSKQIDWDDNEEYYRAWEEARTGFPWIDAIMTQLRQEGWIHHLARHSVACFLTRGDLYVSWEKGRDTFDRLLVDGDYFVNNGNWMWLSASAFFSQFFRVYSPESFGKKYDKSGDYVRHYIPALKDMPEKYIYKPWEAPEDVQKKAKCIIGKDYPHPIVDHKEASEKCKDRMKAAYDSNKKGETPNGKKIKSPPTSPSKGQAKKQKKGD